MPRASDRAARALVAALVRQGVRHAVIAPGSRNTPLTLALTAPGTPIRSWLHLDERSAAYFALGIARQLDEPVAVVCTSGTAAANFVPAAVEGRLSRIPVIFLTADRPPELRDVGAPQTVDQVGLFGTHVKQAVDLPSADEPSADEGAGTPIERYVSATVARLVAVALEAPAGPVHVNVPFREPLLDAVTESMPFDPGVPGVEVMRRRPGQPSQEAIERIVGEIGGRRGLIVCGPESPPLPAGAIVALARTLGWPVVADPLSGLRTGTHAMDLVIDTADTLAREPAFLAQAAPEVVVRLGASPTSKPLNQWLASLGGAAQILVDPGAPGASGWRDPDLRADLAVAADPAATCAALLDALPSNAAVEASWADRWCEANGAAATALREAIEAIDEPFEGRLAMNFAGALPDGATLVAGNSMPVRDVDSFFPVTARDIRLAGTRGASGIDGVTSTAAGAAAVAAGPVVLFTGDLSFIHDINGLWPVGRYELNLTVVLANNDGGGIFHFLPQRTEAPERFEEWWGTPHGLDLRHAVELHRGRHGVLGAGDASEAIRAAVERPGLDVLELRTERDRNVELHRRVWEHAAGAVRATLAAARA